MILRLPAILILALTLGACAKKADPNTFGGRLVQAGGDVATIGEQWNGGQEKIAEGAEMIEDGENEIAKGNKQIKKGEARVDDGETMIARGQRMIAEGERAVAEAERAYNSRITVPPLN